MQRRMAAIMVGDIVGYSAMMEKSEDAALASLAACDSAIEQNVGAFDSRIFNKAGDATLAEFASPINALRCAVGIGSNWRAPPPGARPQCGCASACISPTSPSAATTCLATASI